jgi:hypothetical protein
VGIKPLIFDGNRAFFTVLGDIGKRDGDSVGVLINVIQAFAVPVQNHRGQTGRPLDLVGPGQIFGIPGKENNGKQNRGNDDKKSDNRNGRGKLEIISGHPEASAKLPITVYIKERHDSIVPAVAKTGKLWYNSFTIE